MIEAILPRTAAWSERFDDSAEAALLGEEKAEVADAVDKRRREFATGRLCARAALARLGVPPVPILRDERGAPQWPSGIVGSVTHCAGYRAAAAGRTTDLVTLGIDAEPDAALPAGVLALIARPDELGHVQELTRLYPHGPAWDRLLFCAKEAVYKAWYPLTRRWLGFDQAEITIDPSSGTFSTLLLVPEPRGLGNDIPGFVGRWLAQDDFVIAAIAVSRRPESEA